jgi:hypothetical protein
MSQTIATKIETILQHAQPAIRDKLSQHLHVCGFTDPDDPILNALVAQSMIAGQPVRLVERDGASVATEAGLAMLGNRLEDTMWLTLYPKWGKIAAVWLLSVILTGAGVWTGMKIIQPPDERVLLLERAGADLQVDVADNATRVFFNGEIQPVIGKASDGRNYFFFPQK